MHDLDKKINDLRLVLAVGYYVINEVEKMNDLPKGTRIIECESMELDDKDIIVLKEWDDFLYLLGTFPTIYKLKDSYYNMGDRVVFVYNENNKKQGES